MSTDDRFKRFNNTTIHVPIDASLYSVFIYLLYIYIIPDIPASKGKYLSSRFFNIRLLG